MTRRRVVRHAHRKPGKASEAAACILFLVALVATVYIVPLLGVKPK